MKKIILGIILITLLTSLVLAMNLRTSSWLPKYDSTRNYTLIVNQGDNLDKVCSLGIFSSSCYMSEWSSGDPKDYDLDISCEGTGCQFMKNIPAETQFLANGTRYKYNWAMQIPTDAVTGEYQVSICGTISDPTVGGIGISLSGCGSDKFTVNGTSTPACNENWSCSIWNKCYNLIHARTCTDLNNCGTTNTKPAETQSCICKEKWVCGTWSKCKNKLQTRTCRDANNCGTNSYKPVTTRNCGGGVIVTPKVIKLN